MDDNNTILKDLGELVENTKSTVKAKFSYKDVSLSGGFKKAFAKNIASGGNTIEYLKNENMISLMTQKEREYYKQNPTIKTALFIAEKDYEQRRFGNKIILKGDTSDSVITYYYDFTENSIEILSCTGEITKLDADDIMEITITLLENCLYEYYAKYGGVDKYYQAIMDGREKNSIIIVRGIIEALDEADLEYENQRKLSKKPKDN